MQPAASGAIGQNMALVDVEPEERMVPMSIGRKISLGEQGSKFVLDLVMGKPVDDDRADGAPRQKASSESGEPVPAATTN